jgi:hypothetical protein
VAETAVADIRETTEPVVSRVDEGMARVATAEDTAVAVKRAQRALLEIQARTAAERANAAEEAERLEQARQRQVEAAAEHALTAE